MVCSDIKEALSAKVAGSCPEKVCYRVLSLLAVLAFLLAIVNVLLGVTEVITEVAVDNLDVILFPTAWFCLPPALADSMQLAPRSPCTETTQATVGVVDLKGDGGESRSCIGFGNRDNSTLARELEARFRAFTGGEAYNCYTMNEKDKVSSVPQMYTQMYFEWDYEVTAAVRASGALALHAGVLDPKGKTFAEQAENGLSKFEVDPVNTNTQIMFTVDELVKQDITGIFTSTKAGAQVKRLSEMSQVEAVNDILTDDGVVLKYNPSKNSKKMRPVTEVEGVTYTGAGSRTNRGRIEFLPLSYVTRVVTRRYKTWDEVWSAIGGAWATAVLLVTAFYVQRTVEDPRKKGDKAEPLEQVQTLRLRGHSSRRAAIKSLFAVASDAHDAGKSNLEEGQAVHEAVQ